MSTTVAVQHPLIGHHLSILRNKETPPALFRQQVQRLTSLIAFAATEDLAVEKTILQTPLVETEGQRIKSTVGLVPILRAGLGMVEPLQDLLPDAEVWHLGMYRDEATSQPVEYYSKLPPGRPCEVAFVLDPMLATGGSLISAIEALQKWGCKDIRVLSIIASQPGTLRMAVEHPNVKIYVAAIDPELNDVNFIVPGLGDAGDRIFNTP